MQPPRQVWANWRSPWAVGMDMNPWCLTPWRSGYGWPGILQWCFGRYIQPFVVHVFYGNVRLFIVPLKNGNWVRLIGILIRIIFDSFNGWGCPGVLVDLVDVGGSHLSSLLRSYGSLRWSWRWLSRQQRMLEAKGMPLLEPCYLVWWSGGSQQDLCHWMSKGNGSLQNFLTFHIQQLCVSSCFFTPLLWCCRVFAQDTMPSFHRWQCKHTSFVSAELWTWSTWNLPVAVGLDHKSWCAFASDS